LIHPPQLRADEIAEVFGRVPGTRNPPKIGCDRLERLIALANRQATQHHTKWPVLLAKPEV
jgi:hypothetical protein